MVEYSYDPDDRFDRYRDDRREEMRLESMMIDALRQQEMPQRQEDPVIRVINDPSIKMTAPQKKAINDPKVMMNSRGQLVKAQTMARQMSNRVIYPPLGAKRTRKKTKMDRTMSKCLKMANAKLRNKNGKLKKGKTMSDVMKMAHRLCRKHG